MHARSAFVVEDAGLRLTRTNNVLPWESIVAAALARPDKEAVRLADRRLAAAIEAGAVTRLLLVHYWEHLQRTTAIVPAEGDLAALQTRLGNRWQAKERPFAAQWNRLHSRGRLRRRLTRTLRTVGGLLAAAAVLALLILAESAVEVVLTFVVTRFAWLIATAGGVAMIVWGARSIALREMVPEQPDRPAPSSLLWGIGIVLVGIVLATGALLATFAPEFAARLQSQLGLGGALLFAGTIGVLWSSAALLMARREEPTGLAGLLAKGRVIGVATAVLAASVAALAAGVVLALGLLRF
ncbi:MAG: hypothetical protein KatS3mg060_3561 [Dehalococcoidia bacterium]|nr:MAG: hypothetical protein KatS3mg060_3561 [Dehalococcoidia bacterium]